MAKLIIVDIQPEYEKSIGFNLMDFFKNIQSYSDILYLYNGYDTLGMVQQFELKDWMYNKMDFDEDFMNFVESEITFYDKGYAFFRYCIDNYIEDDLIAKIIRFMYKNNIRDSRELDEIMWDKFKGKYSDDTVRELLEYAGDCINIPDLMDELKDIKNNIVLVGGGVNECLKEVELALLALNKKFSIDKKWTY